MSPPLLILLGEEFFAAVSEPSLPCTPHSTRAAVKQHLQLLSWVAAAWDPPSHTATSAPGADTTAMRGDTGTGCPENLWQHFQCKKKKTKHNSKIIIYIQLSPRNQPCISQCQMSTFSPRPCLQLSLLFFIHS